jgi:hypothetical protein
MQNWHWQQRAFILVMGAMTLFVQVGFTLMVADEWHAGRPGNATAMAVLDVAAWGAAILSMTSIWRTHLTVWALRFGPAELRQADPRELRAYAMRDPGCRGWRNLAVSAAVVIGGVLSGSVGCLPKVDVNFRSVGLVAIIGWAVVSYVREWRKLRSELRALRRQDTPVTARGS